jgi:hypothetical protein
MRTISLLLLAAIGALAFVACDDDDGDGAAKPVSGSDNPAITSDSVDKESLTLTTDDVSLDPGQERYLCFATTLDEDAVIDSYSSEAQPFVHHIVFVRTLAPEPDGFAECDTLFRMTWDPLYISGAGASTLKFPSDAGHKLTKGTQLLAQLHLLNASDDMVQGRVAIKITCSYDNHTPEEVTFGESTHDEMCFFIAFAMDRSKIASCGSGMRQDMPMSDMK